MADYDKKKEGTYSKESLSKITAKYADISPIIQRETYSTPSSSTVGDFTYEGNPTQPHMAQSATNGIRYIIVHATSYNTTSFGRQLFVHFDHIGAFNFTSDNIASVADVTGDGGFPHQNIINNSGAELRYNTVTYAGTTGAHYRTYNVGFDSGHVETISILATDPNDYLSYVRTLVYNPGTGGNFNIQPSDCSSAWNGNYGYIDYDLGTGASYTTSFSKAIDNPFNLIPEYSSAFYQSTDMPGLSDIMVNISDLYDVNTSSNTTWKIFDNPAKQKFEVIATYSVSPGTHYSQILTEGQTNSYSTSLDNIAQQYINGTLVKPFTSYVVYAENLPSCTPTTYTIDGCTDPNNMAYWGYTGTDCASVAIPTAVQTDPTIATWTPGSCCPDCIHASADDITYSTQPLTLNVQGTNPTTISGTDGYIDVTIVDQGFDSSGVPLGLPTGTANYTYVIQNQDATDTMCGNTAGLGVGSGAVAFTSFTFGNSVTSNINSGLLQTGAVGSATYAASAIQGYVPGGTSTSAPYGLGTTNSEGFREGTYNVYVFDASTTVCLGQTTISLTDPVGTVGCTDNTALNYDATATTADNTNCHYCNAETGHLLEGSIVIPQNLSPISQISGSIGIIHPATDTTDTGAEIEITGVSATAAFQSYINNIVTGTTQNADYKIELYRWDLQQANGNIDWVGTNNLTAFNANTTQIGSTINNQGAGWNVALNTATLGAGLIYGYYSIKVYVDDPDSASEQEQCYDILDIIIPIPVCVDNGVATAADGVIVTDWNLYFHDPYVCSIVNAFCCNTPVFSQSTSSTLCDLAYECEIICTPTADSLLWELQYNNNGIWMATGTTGSVSSPISPLTIQISNSELTYYGDGDYRIKVESQYSASANCVIYSNVENITLGIWGCTDPNAMNYNVSATCDVGCTYCVYGCTDADATNYNASATCDDGSCYTEVPGCTDMTADNYNPAATIDDGSCIYLGCGCTDPLAYNYGYNINGDLIGDPPPCDDGNCQYCDDPPLTFSYTATGTTLISEDGCLDNCDGTLTLTVTSAICNTWSIVYMYSFCGIINDNIYVLGYNTYSTGVTVIENLCSAVYTIVLEDCNGCQMQVEVSVPGAGAPCGCTDPAADNYCATCTIDDGSCEYCGCTDTGAINYNPNATANCDPDTCEYPALLPPCIPPTIGQTFKQLEICIAENGFNYYNKILTGKTDDCSTMNVWKLILIDYLLKRKGLDCIYNCADANTPDASDVYISCNDLWIKGGPTTGLNDADVNTLIPAVGTTSTVDMFAIGSISKLSPGDVIKHHNSENIWIFFGPAQDSLLTSTSVAGLDPENASGNLSGYWGYCNDDMRYISNTNNINYIDNFINFANKFCKDCENTLNAPIPNNSNIGNGSNNPNFPGPIEDDTDIDIS